MAAEHHPTVLIINGDPDTRGVVSEACEEAGLGLEAAPDARRGFEIVRRASPPPEAVVLEMRSPDFPDEAALEGLKRLDRQLPIIVLSARAAIPRTLDAGQSGVFHYLTKPLQLKELVGVLRRAVAKKREAQADRKSGVRASLAERMGESGPIARLIDQVETVIRSDYSVLLIGETGTGKELVAQALHEHGPRHGKPFVPVDCGALVDSLLDSELFGHERGAFTGAVARRRGRFELAAGGTLFLDEIGNLSPAAQRALLRALETRTIYRVGGAAAVPLDLRVIAATNEAVEQRTASGTFRRDLYFRLAEYTIVLPPLRSRPADIEHIARRLLGESASALRRPPIDISPSALALLRGHDWPGNVRELRNVIRRAALAAGKTVTAADIAGALGSGTAACLPLASEPGRGLLCRRMNERIRAVEREAFLEALAQAGGNKAAAARLFGVDYKTFRTKLKAVAGARAGAEEEGQARREHAASPH